MGVLFRGGAEEKNRQNTTSPKMEILMLFIGLPAKLVFLDGYSSVYSGFLKKMQEIWMMCLLINASELFLKKGKRQNTAFTRSRIDKNHGNIPMTEKKMDQKNYSLSRVSMEDNREKWI